MWKSEAYSSNQNLASRRELRPLEDRVHVLQRNLELSKASETLTSRAATEQMARIELSARASAQEACDLRRESAHYEERMIEDAVIARRCWESQARGPCETADQRSVWYEDEAFENLEHASEEQRSNTRIDWGSSNSLVPPKKSISR